LDFLLKMKINGGKKMDDNEIISEYEKEKKSLKTRLIVIMVLVAIIVAIASSEFTMFYYNKKYGMANINFSENSEENIEIITDTLKSFREVIDNKYIGEIDERKMLDETIKGYINGLGDQYSSYMTKEEWEAFEASALGNYVGIGIFMGMDTSNNVVVASTIKQSPAEKAGLKAGDIIVRVNEEDVIGMPSDVISSKIKGEVGSKVKVTVVRGTETLDFNLKREELKVYHVETAMFENNVGYISLLTFDEGCAKEVEEAYKSLKAQGAKKFILDLRNNSGGLVDEALDIADLAVEKDKTLLVTLDSEGNKEYSKAERKQTITEDMVVLVNGYSASASEILAGALRDSGNVKIVGTTTFGKGVIQGVFLLDDGSALKLTINEYFTPNETKINKIGIEPDYVIEQNQETTDDEQLNKALEILK